MHCVDFGLHTVTLKIKGYNVISFFLKSYCIDENLKIKKTFQKVNIFIATNFFPQAAWKIQLEM